MFRALTESDHPELLEPFVTATGRRLGLRLVK